jgi:hypothetical protein
MQCRLEARLKENYISILGRDRDFFVLHCVQNDWGPCSILQIGDRAVSLAAKA